MRQNGRIARFVAAAILVVFAGAGSLLADDSGPAFNPELFPPEIASPETLLPLTNAPAIARLDGDVAAVAAAPPRKIEWPLAIESRPATTSAAPLPPFVHRIRGDLRSFADMPFTMTRRDWRDVAIAGAAIGAVGVFDRQIRNSVQSESASSRGLANDVRPLGQVGGLGLLALSWLGGHAAHNHKLVAIADDGFEAVTMTDVLVVPVLKAAFGRGRPRNVGSDSDEFVMGGQSFPSGEASEAFAIASVITAHEHRWWVDAAAWGGAGLVGWARMRLDAHWASDVVGGAIIGASIGRWVVRRNDEQRWMVIPRIGHDTAGAQVSMKF